MHVECRILLLCEVSLDSTTVQRSFGVLTVTTADPRAFPPETIVPRITPTIRRSKRQRRHEDIVSRDGIP